MSTAISEPAPAGAAEALRESVTLPTLEAATRWLAHYRAREARVSIFVGGGTQDIAHPGLPFRDYIARKWLRTFPYQVRFSRDEGFTFPGANAAIAERSRRAFLELTGLAAEAARPAEPDAFADLLGVQPGAPKKGELPRDPAAALELIQRFLEAAEPGDRSPTKEYVGKCLAIIDRLDFLLPGGADQSTMRPTDLEFLGRLVRMGTSDQLDRARNALILLAPSAADVQPALKTVAASIPLVKVGLPDEDRRLDYIRYRLQKYGDKAPLAAGYTAERFAYQTAGLYLRHVEDIFLRAASQRVPIDDDLVLTKKREGILAQFGGVLELVEPTVSLDDLDGMDEYKALVDQWMLEPQRRGIAGVMPKAIIKMGPPGTAKTDSGYATARALGWNCVKWNMEALKGKFYGDSGRNIEAAFEGLEALPPVYVVVDEADQQMRRVTGGGGGSADQADASLFGRMLQFVEDPSHQDRIIFDFLTNKPDQMDPALVSRCDYRIPLLPPENTEARARVLVKLVTRAGLDIREVTGDDLARVAEGMDGWSGRDMRDMVKKAAGLARIQGVDLATALARATLSRRPLQRSDADEMTKLAILECNDLDLLPEKYRAQAPSINPRGLRRDIAELRRMEDRQALTDAEF